MATRGGRRPGAGRPKGSKNKIPEATPESKREMAVLARQHADVALKALIDIATNGQSEAARVSAANSLLDRGYGKAPQKIEGESEVRHIHTIKTIVVEADANRGRYLDTDYSEAVPATNGAGPV